MFLRTVARSLARRPKHFAVAVLAVGMGIGMTVALASVSLVLRERLARTVRAYGANLVVRPRGADLPVEIAGADVSARLSTAALPESGLAVLETFRWRNNVLAYAPQSTALATVGRSPAGSAVERVPVVGTWFRRERRSPDGRAWVAGMAAVAPWWKVHGRLPGEEGEEALVGRALAARLGVRAGDALWIALDGDRTRSQAVRVAGIVDAGGFEDDRLFVALPWLQRATGREGRIETVLVSAMVLPGDPPPMPDPARDLEAFERWSCRPFAATVGLELESAWPGAEARPVASLVRGEGRLVGRLNLLMLLLTGAALTAAVLGVTSSMVASVVDRTAEIGLLRSLGATRNAVARLFLAEAFAVAIVGGLLGIGLGAGLAQIIGRGAFATPIAPHPLILPVGLVLALGVCAAGAWWPLRKVTAVDPAQTLRPGA